MNDSSLVQVEHLFRYYGDLCAVRDVSFTIERGEVLGFLGPNGAGKSTTMQIISGNLAPSAGQVRIDGFDILDEPRLAKERLGYLEMELKREHIVPVNKCLIPGCIALGNFYCAVRDIERISVPVKDDFLVG